MAGPSNPLKNYSHDRKNGSDHQENKSRENVLVFDRLERGRLAKHRSVFIDVISDDFVDNSGVFQLIEFVGEEIDKWRVLPKNPSCAVLQ